ncbi:cGMP-dependent protein kinase, isozyme 1 isoform X2 [Eupeodes corollae]|uniref:cGMP-dependent protein kinase, isozyme 1 isoform X2 n=1 Tax=Eupeodes corollae TaxID=290404 RepID=UPI00249267EC|nr:cGMP-dependent protein kinase, isozyme 1 isoform X2 [Eupeodes corollae]
MPLFKLNHRYVFCLLAVWSAIFAQHIQPQTEGISIKPKNKTQKLQKAYSQMEKSTSGGIQISPKRDGLVRAKSDDSYGSTLSLTVDDKREYIIEKSGNNDDINERDEHNFGSVGKAISILGAQRASNFRSKFRKSHTCGSLFAKCSCSPPVSPAAVGLGLNLQLTPLTDGGGGSGTDFRAEIDTKLFHNYSHSTSSTVSTPNTNTFSLSHDSSIDNGSPSQLSNETATSPAIEISCSPNQIHIERVCSPTAAVPNKTPRKIKRLYQSFSHPDTAYIFTDENKNPARDRLSFRYSPHQPITTRGGKVEIKHPKRSSSPNIGNLQVLDVAVHPDILVKISPKHSPKEVRKQQADRSETPISCRSLQQRRRLLKRSEEHESGSTSDSETYPELRSPTKPVDVKNPVSPLSPTQQFSKKDDENFTAAQKYFLESGILGPVTPTPTSSNLIRKTSKILQDSNTIELIRKNSMNYRNCAKSSTASSPTLLKPGGTAANEECSSPPQFSSPVPQTRPRFYLEQDLRAAMEDQEEQIKYLQGEIASLNAVLKCRDSEIVKLRREVHKLKSVLHQTTTAIPLKNDEFLRSIQNNRCMTAQQQQCPEVTSTIGRCSPEIPKDIPTAGSICIGSTLRDSVSQAAYATCALTAEGDDKTKQMAFNKNYHAPSAPVLKKQGVSGESCDSSSVQLSINVPIPKFDKDYESKQLIKDAIMDNDFLKNIDSSQVRELVESMYSLDVVEGEYVIREGDAGAHLYVSAEGEFEVVKGGNVLGVMGPGKAFGELAILYNCTRTASIRVLSNARVWVLDRRVFQQIMMRTGMKRIENSVNFLKSVPLLKNLSNDVLAKIADVLEVEFYPAGTYIIRQGASGDTFFLISQGTVQVTQKIGPSSGEKNIRTLQRGDYFGEQALINEDKRTANIIADAPGVECLTLDRESFTHLIGDLCELKEKNYGDENRILAMKYEQSKEIFGANAKQEFPDMKLTDLEVVATLGVGGFGRVELVKAYRDNCVETFALKCLKKKHILDTRQEEHVFSERTIMLTCNTPFICRLYRTFRDDKYLYMLLEACMGGEVWTMLRDRGSFDENATQFIIGCVLQAFEYLHSRGIIYRDLKPENLMLDEKGYIKLVDFGFAKHIGNSSKTWTFCGTPEYVAPEIILNRGHDRAVDYWALGILIHELLNGTPPFTANDPMKTYNIILKGIDMIDFPKHISRSAIQLIKKLCRDVPAERLGYQKGGIQDIKKHKWFLGFDWDGLASQLLIPPFVRPVSHPTDTIYFDRFPMDPEEPPDETSGWDADF